MEIVLTDILLLKVDCFFISIFFFESLKCLLFPFILFLSTSRNKTLIGSLLQLINIAFLELEKKLFSSTLQIYSRTRKCILVNKKYFT